MSRIHNPALDAVPAPAKGPRSASGVLLNVPRETVSHIPAGSPGPTAPNFQQVPDPVNPSLLKNISLRWDPNQTSEAQDPSLDVNQPAENQEGDGDEEETGERFSPNAMKTSP